MKKFLLISLLLHSTFLLVKQQEAQQEVEISFETSSGTQKEGQAEQEQKKIIPKSDGDGESQVNKNYFWGIGISVVEYYNMEMGKWVIEVKEVHTGYSAEEVGIMAGDLITSINGKGTEVEEIIGDGPATIRLTIFRNGAIIVKTLDRVKVYY